MKPLILYLLSVALCCGEVAGVKMDTLVLTNGRKLTKVEVIRATAAGLEIRHEFGSARLKPELLPESVRFMVPESDEDRANILAEEKEQVKEFRKKQALVRRAYRADVQELRRGHKTKGEALQEIIRQIRVHEKTIKEAELAKLKDASELTYQEKQNIKHIPQFQQKIRILESFYNLVQKEWDLWFPPVKKT